MSNYRGRYAGGPLMSAELTASSGAIAANAEGAADVVVSHDLGVVPSMGPWLLEDGSWAHQFGIRKGSTWSTTQVSFRFQNNGPNAGSAVLRFRLIY